MYVVIVGARAIASWSRFEPSKPFDRLRIGVRAGLLLTTLLLTPMANAQSFVCERGEDTRRVTFDYPGEQNLCEVAASYADGTRKVVWFANGGSQFCSTKISELIGKYRNQWNWSCEAVASLTQLDTLSTRERLFLDDMVRSVVRQGRQADPAFGVSGVRAFSDQAEQNSRMVVQLGINAVDESVRTDRVYVVGFTEDGYQLEAMHVGLDRLVIPENDTGGQTLVTQMNSDSSFLVTAVYERSGVGTSEPDRECVTEAVLKPSTDGKLELSGRPEVACE